MPLLHGGIPTRERRHIRRTGDALLEGHAYRQGGWTRHAGTGATSGRGDIDSAGGFAGLRRSERLRRLEEDEPPAARADQFRLAGVRLRADVPRAEVAAEIPPDLEMGDRGSYARSQ